VIARREATSIPDPHICFNSFTTSTDA